jgi:hypothetical protein
MGALHDALGAFVCGILQKKMLINEGTRKHPFKANFYNKAKISLSSISGGYRLAFQADGISSASLKTPKR